MADFDAAVYKTLKFEGGFVNNRNDPGGPTNFGITLRVLQGCGELGDADLDGDIDIDDMQILTKDVAISIYRDLYWRGDGIFSQAIAEKHFDMSVNMGVVTASKYLQLACLQLDTNLSILVDGVIGPKSVETINCLPEEDIMAALVKLHAGHYWNIIEYDIRKNAISRGWPSEAITCALEAIKSKDVTVAYSVLVEIKKLKLKEGKLDFLRGWMRRAEDTFGI